ncbi:SDR family NAD(P)-dependent oxidoreductase [Geodermatophilus sp. URMC 62]|uniref:SDR family NAD(P)-dependent oxidoreductase n=1 Tax=Geodermatophilus sp. URMC 62 TaxID=3423414 RepID=UPI00406D275B
MTVGQGLLDLAGKVVWVTGAGKGLGRAMAQALSGAGATVVLSARSGSDLDELAGTLRAEGREAHVQPLDVTDAAAVRAATERVAEAAGRIDGLVNCAGISPSFTRSEDLDDASWTQVIGVNLTGTFHCCREVGRLMLQAGGGSIANVSSVHARSGAARIAAYTASKGGVEALTRTLAVEWAARGVRVNTIAPGYFETDLSAPLLGSRHAEGILSKIPLGRVGDAAELGGAAVFLMSDASRYTTGSTLTVDGGWTAW